MVAFGHSAVGVSVGVVTYSAFASHNPVLGLAVAGALGIASHYLCDLIPHGHFVKFNDLKKKIFVVIVFDLIFSILLFSGAEFLKNGLTLRLLYILFGIGGALIPDVIDTSININLLPYKGFFKYEYDLQQLMHWHGSKEKGLPIGWWDISQFGLVILALYLTFK